MKYTYSIQNIIIFNVHPIMRVWIMSPGFHRVDGRGREGGRGELESPSPFLQASISFQEITNLITQTI